MRREPARVNPGIGYRLVLLSAVGEREGMALELTIDTGERIAEVFEDESTHERTVTFFTVEPVPVEAIEWLLDEARTGL